MQLRRRRRPLRALVACGAADRPSLHAISYSTSLFSTRPHNVLGGTCMGGTLPTRAQYLRRGGTRLLACQNKLPRPLTKVARHGGATIPGNVLLSAAAGRP